jgi:hypothetical protein
VVSSNVVGLNDWGQLVGSYETAGGVSHSFVLTGTYLQELVLPAEWGGEFMFTTAINDFGVVIGNYQQPPATTCWEWTIRDICSATTAPAPGASADAAQLCAAGNADC